MNRRRKQITWTDLELNGLIEDEDSCVFWERINKHITLNPLHFKNITLALNEILSNNLNFYDPTLRGFALLYQNPKLLTDADFWYDSYMTHVGIEAEYYIFRPEIGKNIKGIVNKKAVNHLGVLVHKAFNVSIQKPAEDTEGIIEKISIGQEIRFTISFLDFTHKFPVIRGTLDKENYLQGCKIFETNNEVTEKAEDKKPIIIKSEEKMKKKKKKTLSAEYVTEEEIHSSNDEDNTELNNISESKKKHKKKKKDENLKQTDTDISDIDSFLKKNKKNVKVEKDHNISKSPKKIKNNIQSQEKEINSDDSSVLDSETELKKRKKKLQKSLHLTKSDSESIEKEQDLVKKKEKKQKNTSTDDVLDSEVEKNHKKQLREQLFKDTLTVENKTTEEKIESGNDLVEKIKKKKKQVEDVAQNLVLDSVCDSEVEKKYKKRLHEQLFNSPSNTIITTTDESKKDKEKDKRLSAENSLSSNSTVKQEQEFKIPTTRKKKKNKDNEKSPEKITTDSSLQYPDSDSSTFSCNKEKLKKYKKKLRKSLGISDSEESQLESPKKSKKRKLDEYSDGTGSKVFISEEQPIFLTPKVEKEKKLIKKSISKTIDESLNGLENICFMDKTPAKCLKLSNKQHNETLTPPSSE